MIRGCMGSLALALAGVLSSCAFALDFDELQEGGEPSAGTGGSSTAGTGGEAAAGGSEGGAAGAAEPGIALEDAAAVLAETMCSKLEACVGAAAVKVLLADEDCAVAVESGLANTFIANIQQSEANGTLEYDGSAVPTCLEAYDTLPCEEVAVTFPEARKQALGGLLGEGEDCSHSLECEAGLYCSADACPGTCSTPLQDGDPCTEIDTCAPGLTCFQGACAPLGGEGDDCGAELLPECVTGFVCLNEDTEMMTPGNCFSAKDVFVLSQGQPCNLGGTPTLCRVGLSCPLVIGATCLEPVESGGACDLALPDMCPEGEYCSFGNPNCLPLPGAGDPCAPGILLKPRCQAYLRCVNEVCRPLGDNGDPCGDAAECYSGVCGDSGECAASACQ